MLIRGLAQKCPNPPMKTLVTYGAPSNGVFGVPDCETETGSYELCEFVRQVLAAAAYDPDLQVLKLYIYILCIYIHCLGIHIKCCFTALCKQGKLQQKRKKKEKKK